jgi:hypothetical protein
MEQRIQSLVCTISLVRRVLDKQSMHDDGNSKLPLRIIPARQAIQTIVGYLTTLPALLKQFMLERNFSGSGAAGTASSQASNKKARTNGSTSSDGAKDADEVITFDVKEMRRDVTQTIAEIEEILSPISDMFADEQTPLVDATTGRPLGLSWLRDVVLRVRSCVLGVEQYAMASARLRLLTDVLALWAYTTNFSTFEVTIGQQSYVMCVFCNVADGVLLVRRCTRKWSRTRSSCRHVS